MSFNITIFSKDRACQLDQLLRTLKAHFTNYKDNKINVIYKFKNNNHKIGYEKLINEHSEINFICENNTSKNFKELTLSTIDRQKNHTFFLVDDIVIKENFSEDDNEIKSLVTNKEILCVSLRMNEGMSYCHPARIKYRNIPKLENGTWRWHGCEGDWGYPMSVDGHIFRTSDILPIIERIPFNNPTLFEYNLSINYLNQPYMLCYKKSRLFNNPINRVHNNNDTPHSNISEDYILNEYLNGKRMYINANIENTNFISPHFEMPIILR